MPTVYLSSYDKYDDFLAYEPATGAFQILSRRTVDALGARETLGAFTREGDRVAGVFATPDGPCFFLDAVRVDRAAGQITATTVELPAGKRRFTLCVDGAPALDIVYAERHGIGTNPYDNTIEDVDLFAMMARGTSRAQFLAGYTKDWV